MPVTNIEMLQRVANGLGDLRHEVVFVGGSVAELYAVDPELSDIRPTLDIDCVVEISSRLKYYALEEKLISKGFHHDTTPGAPVCRKIYEDIIVDIMPTDPDILGFSNRWYSDGIENKIEKKLPDGSKIFVFPVEYYIATKFMALADRGGNDIRGSHDLEDIVYIMDNAPELVDAISHSGNDFLRQYLKEECEKLLVNSNIREIIFGSLPYNSAEESVNAIADIIRRISVL